MAAEGGVPFLSAKQLVKSASEFSSAFRLLPRLEKLNIRRVCTLAATFRRKLVYQPDPPPRAPATGLLGFTARCWRALSKGTAWAGFVAFFRPSRGGLSAIWRQVEKTTTRQFNSSSWFTNSARSKTATWGVNKNHRP